MLENANNVSDSLVFLSIARKTICETISNTKSANLSEMTNFVINEATDYEIMSLLVDNEMPEYRYNEEAEEVLWDKMRKGVFKNPDIFSESVSEKVLENILFEIGPVTTLGLSSAIPILEFHKNTGILESILHELPASSYATNYDKTFGKKGIAKLGSKMKGGVGKAYGSVKAGAGKAYGATKSGLVKVGTKMKATGKSVADVMRKYAQKANASQVATKIKANPKTSIAAAVAAAILVYASYKTYKRFYSQAAKACTGKSGADKTECMKNFKIKALKAQLTDLKGAMSACANTSNPAKCQASLKSKMMKVQSQINKAS